MRINNSLINNYNLNNNQNYILTNKDYKLIKKLIKTRGGNEHDSHYYYKDQNGNYYREKLKVNQIGIFNYKSLKNQDFIATNIGKLILIVIIIAFILLLIKNSHNLNDLKNNDSLMSNLIFYGSVCILSIIYGLIMLFVTIKDRIFNKKLYKFISYDSTKNEIIIYRYK